MTSPTEEGGDPADECNNSEVALNDCNAEIEPSFADPNRAHQVETDQIDRQPSTPVSQEADGPQAVENIELEVQKTEKEPQEENSKKKPLLIQIPIPRKWVFLMSGLGRITSLSIQVEPTDKNNPDSSNFYSDKVEGKTNSLCHATINYKIPFQLSISWKIPFISNHDIRRMILHLLCERYISQAGNRPNAMWMKQKYVAFLPRPNGLTNGERAIIFGRPLRLYYHRPITDRITPGKFCKSGNTKGKDGFHIFIRPVFCVPRAQLQNTFNRKAFEDHMRSHPNMPIVIIGTNNSWKYLCPLCGNSFSTLVEFRQHPCRFPRN